MLAAVVAAGCGRLHFDDLADARGTVTGDGATGDGATADASCTFSAWSAPRALTELNTNVDDAGPWLSADRLELVWTSQPGGVLQVNVAQRASLTAPFGGATLVISGSYGDPYESPDGLSLWLDDNGNEPVVATRASTTSPFGTPTPRAELATGMVEDDPDLTTDQLTVAFNDEPSQQLYVATRATPTSLFATPQLFAALNVGNTQCCVTFAGDARSLLFGTDATTPDQFHLYESDAGSAGFGTPFPFAGAANAGLGEDSDPYLTPDGLTVVFDSSRPGGAGGFDLYEIDRTCD